jgi:hypothetical protein
LAISKQDARKTKHAVLAGDERTSTVLDGTTGKTVYLTEITGPTQKFTVQSTGNLAFTYDTSANGANFTGTPVSVAANAMSTYTGPHVVAVVKLTWVSGSGTVAVLAV